MSKFITEQVNCAQCNEPMVILLGMGAPGFFNPQTLYRMFDTGALHGSFQCAKCNRYYCWDCSNNYRKCKCGESEWRERQYLDANFVKQTGIGKQRYNPKVTIFLGFLTYVFGVYALIFEWPMIQEHMMQEHMHAALWFALILVFLGFAFLPAAGIFFAGRGLGWSIIKAGILALAGPTALVLALVLGG